MTPEQLAALSVRLEKATGHDSIPTIERLHREYGTKRYTCPVPGCLYGVVAPERLWKHMHFQPHPHGLSFYGAKTPEEALVQVKLRHDDV